MNLEELHKMCIELQRDCDERKSELKRLYAKEHNPVKVGDIVTDHYHTIRVESMGVYGYSVPMMKYHGTELTKQGIPKKRQPVPDNPVFQYNIRSINGKSYKFDEK